MRRNNSSIFWLLLMLVSIGTPVELMAQRKTGRSPNLDVYMGAAIKKPIERTMDQFLGMEDGRFITHAYYSGEDIQFEYDTVLQPVSTARHDRRANPRDFIDKGFIVLDKRSVRLSARTLNYDKANVVYLSELDSALELKKDMEVTRVDGNGFYPSFYDAHLGYAVSEDKSKFVVYFKKVVRAYKSEDLVQRFRFVAFDSTLKKLWAQDVDFTSDDGIYRLGGSDWAAEGNDNSISIADNGTVFCWGRTDKGDGYDNEHRYHVKLSKISSEGHEMVGLSGDQSKKVRDWTIIGTENGMAMAANYMDWENTTRSYLEKSDGLAFVSWSGAVKQRPIFKFIEFNNDYMTLNQPKSVVKRVKRNAANGAAGAFEDDFEINGLRMIDQTNCLVIAETRHDSVRYNAELARDIITYTRGDAQFFSVNIHNGNLNWSTRVPKYQKNRTGVGLGFVSKVLNDKLYVIFNDDFDNIEKGWTPVKGIGKFSKMDNPIVLVAIDMKDSRAEAKREKLWKSEKTGSYFEPKNFFSVPDSDNGLLYLNDGAGKERFVRMIFK